MQNINLFFKLIYFRACMRLHIKYYGSHRVVHSNYSPLSCKFSSQDTLQKMTLIITNSLIIVNKSITQKVSKRGNQYVMSTPHMYPHGILHFAMQTLFFFFFFFFPLCREKISGSRGPSPHSLEERSGSSGEGICTECY